MRLCKKVRGIRFWRTAKSELFGGREGQAAFAVEEFLQPPVAGTRFAPVGSGRDKLAAFAAGTPAFQPVFPTDRAFNRDARDF